MIVVNPHIYITLVSFIYCAIYKKKRTVIASTNAHNIL